ncbi:MAG: N-ethylammeline chlorohydrolase [Thermoproteota archaeon]|nr:MAG: N-ethylammeline chlorohydrolase [Candidatus Korarchaeota archaeon]
MRQEVDLLIKNVMILPVVPKGSVIRNGFIAISDGKIKDFGPMEKMSNLVGKEVLSGKGMCALPGLINTHTHAPMTLLRGVGDGLPLDKWLKEAIWPREAKLSEEDIYWGTMLACLEMIMSGTTCFVDMYLKEDGVAKAVLDSGLRAFLSYGMIDLGSEEKREQELKITRDFVKRWHGAGEGRIRCMIAPHAPYTCSKELLLASKAMADEMKIMLNIHLSETKTEVQKIKELTGMRPVEYLESLNFLGPNVLAAHCVWLSNEEIRLLAKRGVSVSHCPSSNAKLGSGIAPVKELISEGANVTIGTDGCASNDDLDMFEEMRLACFLQRVRLLDPTAMKALDALEMATINAAHALKIEKEIGSIEKGKKADIILVNLDVPRLVPLNDLVSNLVFSASGNNVKSVIVNGRLLMKNGKVLSMEEDRVLKEACSRLL